MHIPDGFLSTPVWTSLGAVSLPTIGVLARKAQAHHEHSRAPLLGVMGAFVFAAQMVNFPVAGGASSHLLGGALLACSIGPAAGVIVMTAVLAIQAFVFQDGGILALGANVFNLAIAGVLTAYVPYHFWGAGRYRRVAIFAGAALSVLVSAALAMSQILLSGVPVTRPLLQLSAGLFAFSAVAEGVITVAVLGAIERINPEWVQRPAARTNRLLTVVGATSVLVAMASIFIASTAPDALERIEIAVNSTPAAALIASPFAGYRFTSIVSDNVAKAFAGLIGLALVYFVCSMLGRAVAQRRSA
jgi:cobalt/nickel transport system permease protein